MRPIGRASAFQAAAVGVAAVAAAVGLFAGPVRAQFGPMPVYLEPVQKRTVRRSVELVGTAEALRRAVLGAEVAGRVEAVEAEEGDVLEAGAVVCRLRTRVVALALEQAKARLAAARADLAKMEAGYRKEEVAQAEARASAAQADLDRWRKEHERTRRLLADGASTQSEMDAVEAAYRAAREHLAEAQAALALYRAGFRAEEVERARAEVAAQSAAVAELEDRLQRMTVRMPFPGCVVRKLCEVGEWLNPGSPVAEVVDLSVVRVRLDVPERHLPGLRRGEAVPVVFEALGEDREFTGRVSQIVPVSAEATHTVTVRVDVENPQADGRPTLAAGLVARVWLPVGEPHEALLVPKAAVVHQDDQDVVYTVSDTPPPSAIGGGTGGASASAGGKAQEAGGEGAAASAAGAGQAAGGGQAAPRVRYAVRVPVRIVGGWGRLMEVESPLLRPGVPVVTRGTYLMVPGMPVVATVKEGPAGAAAGGEAKPRPEGARPAPAAPARVSIQESNDEW